MENKDISAVERFYRSNELFCVFGIPALVMLVISAGLWWIAENAPIIGTILVWTVKVLVALGFVIVIGWVYSRYREYYPKQKNASQ